MMMVFCQSDLLLSDFLWSENTETVCHSHWQFILSFEKSQSFKKCTKYKRGKIYWVRNSCHKSRSEWKIKKTTDKLCTKILVNDKDSDVKEDEVLFQSQFCLRILSIFYFFHNKKMIQKYIGFINRELTIFLGNLIVFESYCQFGSKKYP